MLEKPGSKAQEVASGPKSSSQQKARALVIQLQGGEFSHNWNELGSKFFPI